MFTGIITDIGEVLALEQRGDLRARIGTSYDTQTIDIGASIACAGVCLTVVTKGENWFDIDISAESLSRTAIGDWTVGSPVNLERALKVGDELGGHIITGHVDAVGHIAHIEVEGDSRRFTFSIPSTIAAYIVEKGSVCLNGVSLTVNEVSDHSDGSATFGINIIPHTQEKTTFGTAKAGDRVNVEIDVLARYVARLNARA